MISTKSNLPVRGGSGFAGNSNFTSMKDGKCGVHCVAWWLLWVGGINWGLVGLFDWNLVEVIFGSWGWFVRLIYILVGLSALVLLFSKKCGKCKA